MRCSKIIRRGVAIEERLGLVFLYYTFLNILSSRGTITITGASWSWTEPREKTSKKKKRIRKGNKKKILVGYTNTITQWIDCLSGWLPPENREAPTSEVNLNLPNQVQSSFPSRDDGLQFGILFWAHISRRPSRDYHLVYRWNDQATAILMIMARWLTDSVLDKID